MKISVLQRELDELQNNPSLFDAHNFKARKEALDFVSVIRKFRPEGNVDLAHLQRQADELGTCLRAFNVTQSSVFYDRLTENRPTPEDFRASLQLYTDYVPKEWGKPHYGYENLDFLLDEILLPKPHPKASLSPDYGMVRYEPTPASVILELTERISFSAKGVFCDLGSGLGKVTMLVHLLTNVRCVGIEYQPNFCTYAKKQARGLSLSRVHYFNLDARDADYADGTVFFLFNPFGGTIFDTVLERLHQEAKQRKIWICSYGSASRALSEFSWLKQIPPICDDELALAIFQT